MIVHWVDNGEVVCSNLGLCEIKFLFAKIIFDMNEGDQKTLAILWTGW